MSATAAPSSRAATKSRWSSSSMTRFQAARPESVGRLMNQEHPSHPHKPYPILIGSQEIYRGRVVTLRVDTIEVASGNARREVVEHLGAVVIVPVDAEGRILWV